MDNDLITKIRRLAQQHSYTTIQMHESIGRKAGLSGTDHKYLGFLLVNGEMTAGGLSQLTGLTTSAITGLIDRFARIWASRGHRSRECHENYKKWTADSRERNERVCGDPLDGPVWMEFMLSS
jgi:hypothetical protein